jgi:iron complex outermembrane receptor protein
MSPARKLPPFVVLLALVSLPRASDAQTDGSIHGTVRSAGDAAVIASARVVVAGTGLGAVTDQAGAYVITGVPAGTHQVRVRMIGFAEGAQTVTVTAGEVATADFTLERKVLALDAVTVTALGIERTRRETPYTMSEVKSAEITATSPLTVQSALYGEVPGLKIQQNTSGPTGGTNLTIRGIKSLNGNNRPLIVVDGIPIRDENSGYSAVGWEYNRDLGTGINDLNPNDVESVNVLKGASAAALYGAVAANGVILITTKTGLSRGGVGTEFSSSFTTDQVAFLPAFQNEFGAGRPDLLNGPNDGDFLIDTTTGARLLAISSQSWGPRMQGQMVRWWDNQVRPFTPQPDNYRDLYRAGETAEQSIAFSGVTDRMRYRLGYTRNDWTGTFPGSEQQRNTLTFTGDMGLSTRLKASLALNYYDRALTNPPPKVYIAYAFPRSVKADVLRQEFRTAAGYQATYRDFPRLTGSEERLMREILWEGLENRYTSGEDRLVGSLRLNYALAEGLSVRLQGGTDYADNTIESRTRTSQPASAGPSGGYEVRRRQDRVQYGELLLSGQRRVTPAVGLNVQAGAATTRNYTGETAVWTNGGLVAENWFSINNSADVPGRYAGRSRDRTDGVFASATASYRDYLYVTATGRNDWTSTLPPGNNSYFYPSIGASFVFSDAFRLPHEISSGRFRLNYGQVGRGARPYQANNAYSYETWDDGITRIGFSTVVPPLALKPERKEEAEVGLEMAFFDERLGFDATFYRQRNVDQIMDLEVPYSSGATNITVNAGVMANTGQELQLFGAPLRTRDFEWTANLTFARNRNKIESLAAGVQAIVLSNFEDNLYVEARPGRPYGEIYGYDFRRTPDGRKIVDQAGFYAKSDTLSLVGNITPTWLGGVGSGLRYRSLSLAFLLDVRVGGQYAAMSNYYAFATGRLKATLFGRDEAHGGLPYYVDANGNYVRLPSHTSSTPSGEAVHHDGIVLSGVREAFDSSGNVTGYLPNDRVVPTWLYYNVNFNWKTQGIYPQIVYDNNYVKLRELTVTFELPNAWTRGLPAKNVRVSLIGRNLLYLLKTVPDVDPESATSTDDSRQGLNDYGAYHPTTRSLGIKITGSF